uniref:Uncharacterized protein n=1 Tax=Bartonella bacilliformis TaxID=774 RepID=Q6BDB0_BARBA|nr:hypothetical protein [Bartonella bacilliformis]
MYRKINITQQKLKEPKYKITPKPQ